MRRTLVLLRHAKSAWPDDVSDHERPLTPRGRRDAAAVGRWLHERAFAPDVAVVSSARRARETYEAVAGELAGEADVRVTDDAYAAGAGDLLDLVRELPEQAKAAILVSHNPGIGTLASLLDDEAGDVPERQEMRLEFRTAACAVFELAGAWAELDPASARLTAFTAPSRDHQR